MSDACDELPSRRFIARGERQQVRELCEEVWDDHEAAFRRMALDRSVRYAAAVCVKADVCEERTSHEQLYALDPGSEAAKEEL